MPTWYEQLQEFNEAGEDHEINREQAGASGRTPDRTQIQLLQKSLNAQADAGQRFAAEDREVRLIE